MFDGTPVKAIVRTKTIIPAENLMKINTHRNWWKHPNILTPAISLDWWSMIKKDSSTSVGYDEANYQMYWVANYRDSRFIQRMKMYRISVAEHQMENFILCKNSNDSYYFILGFSSFFERYFIRNLPYAFVKITCTAKDWNKTFFILLEVRNSNESCHDTTKGYSTKQDYQNLNDVYEYFKNHTNEDIEIHLTFYRNRVINGISMEGIS